MKRIFIAILMIVNLYTNAQQTREEVKAMLFTKQTIEQIRKVYPNACYFYLSSEDYYNNKPVSDYEIVPNSFSGTIAGQKFEISNNGDIKKIKIADSPYQWASDEDGFLMRMYEKSFYKVVITGPLCYYIQYGYGEVTKFKDTYSFSLSYVDQKFFDRYSETIKGEIKDINDKIIENYVKQYGLYEQYKNDKIKREMRDSVNQYHSKVKNKLVKYIKLVNEKMAK